VLLSYLPQEDAFWLLVTLMHDYGMEGLYRPGLPRFRLVSFQFERLFERSLPKLARHFESECVFSSMYASQWFITVFSYSLPFDVVVRVWDIFIAEGWKIVFRVALGLLRMGQKELLKRDFEGIVPYIKSELVDTLDPETMINAALKVRVTTKQLRQLEAEHTEESGVTPFEACPPPSAMLSPEEAAAAAAAAGPGAGAGAADAAACGAGEGGSVGDGLSVDGSTGPTMALATGAGERRPSFGEAGGATPATPPSSSKKKGTAGHIAARLANSAAAHAASAPGALDAGGATPVSASGADLLLVPPPPHALHRMHSEGDMRAVDGTGVCIGRARGMSAGASARLQLGGEFTGLLGTPTSSVGSANGATGGLPPARRSSWSGDSVDPLGESLGVGGGGSGVGTVGGVPPVAPGAAGAGLLGAGVGVAVGAVGPSRRASVGTLPRMDEDVRSHTSRTDSGHSGDSDHEPGHDGDAVEAASP